MSNSCCSGTLDIRALDARLRRVPMMVLAIDIPAVVMILPATTGSAT